MNLFDIQNAVAYEGVIHAELKRCADEIASVDLSMQTIHDIIRKTVVEEKQEESL